MSELQAAMGLSILNYFDEIKESRRKIVNCYNKSINFNSVRTQKLRLETEWNYHYYPLIFNSENDMLEVISALNKVNVYPRRYFYPSLNTLDYLEEKISMPISEKISSKILCLPLYVGLSKKKQNLIINVVNDIINNKNKI